MKLSLATLLFILIALHAAGQPIYNNSVRVNVSQKPTCENSNGEISMIHYDGSPIAPPTSLFSITENQFVGTGTYFQNIKAGRYEFYYEENGQSYIREFALDNYPAILDSAHFFNYFFERYRGDSCNLGLGSINVSRWPPVSLFPGYNAYSEMVSHMNFTWSNGQSGPQVTGLMADKTYWVKASLTENNCKFYFPFTRFDTTNQSQSLRPSIVKVNRDTVFFKFKNRNTLNIGTTNLIKAYCGLADGSIQVELLNGNVEPVTWKWSNGNSTNLNSNVTAGYYWVTVKNGEGCIGSNGFYLEKKNAPGFQLSLSLQSIDSCLNNTGKVLMEALPGTATPPFLYNTGNGFWDTARLAVNIPSGYQSFYVKDANGCLAYNQLNVPSYSPFTINSQVNSINCQGELGSINVGVTGGLPPYQYKWFLYPEENGPSMDSLMPGSYQLILTDSNQCKTKKNFYVGLPSNCVNNIYLKPRIDLSGNCQPNQSNPILFHQSFTHRILNQTVYYRGDPNVWLSTLNNFGFIQATPRPSFNASCLNADWSIPGINPTSGSIQEMDVLLSPDSLFKNVKYFLKPTGSKPLRPGFDCELEFRYFNHSTQPTGTTYFDIFLPSEVEFIASTYPYEALSGNRYRFPVAALNVGDWSQVSLVVKANPTVVVGTVLPFQIKINPVAGEVNFSDNDKTFPLLVVGSWDPNEISVSPSPYISPNEFDLFYQIEFQNLGNYRTDFVVLKDTLPESVDMSSLRFFHSSNSSFKMEVKGRVLTVRYPYLQLKPASENEAGSKGKFSFTIKRNSDLPIGYAIRNRASIYFDYNPPIQTSEAVVSVFQYEGVKPVISVFPNPASSYVTVTGKSFSAFKIFDMIGREVHQGRTDFSGDLSVSALRNGVYILRLEGEPTIFRIIVDRN